MALLLGIDLGTSYIKVGLFDAAGALRGLGRVAVASASPAPERVELDADVFWQRLRQALALALAEAGATADEIAGVSYSSQANTFVLLDDSGRELTPLVFWHDQRARPLEARLVDFGGREEHAQITGLTGAAPERAPSKWRWFMQHEPTIWARTARALTVSDYFTYCLIGELVGDASTAALTGLYDLGARSWWPAALEQFALGPELLVKPLTPGCPCGRTTVRAAELLGLPAGIPFAVGALDHHAAALGAGIGVFTDASLSTGTVLAALVIVKVVTRAEGCIHGPHVDGRRFYRLAFDPNGAGQLECYQREQVPGLSIEELLRRAEQFHADGTRRDGHGAAVLELLEHIASSQHALLKNAAGTTTVRRIAATGGGARSPLLLQLQADRLRTPIVTMTCAESACLGAALFAGVAAGWFRDPATAGAEMVHPSREYCPR
jgi:xylulokinase